MDKEECLFEAINGYRYASVVEALKTKKHTLFIDVCHISKTRESAYKLQGT